MFPLEVDPGWYDKYWLNDRPGPKRRPFSMSVTWFAAISGAFRGWGVGP
jgi:hypothetical protein